MREHPWHVRSASTQHYLWFDRLMALHELTQAWLEELRLERTDFRVSRGLPASVTENSWMLDVLNETRSAAYPVPARGPGLSDMEPLLDDSFPEDTLGRLEHTIWSVQAWTLTGCEERVAAEQRDSLESVLEQASWKTGRRWAERNWPRPPSGLRAQIFALSGSLLQASGFGEEPFLIRRALHNEIELELRCCPHRSRFPEVLAAADDLCRLHAQWMRGFLYALDSRVILDESTRAPASAGAPAPRCRQRWYISGTVSGAGRA